MAEDIWKQNKENKIKKTEKFKINWKEFLKKKYEMNKKKKNEK